MDNIIISVQNLTKQYSKGSDKLALNNISFEVQKGEFLSVLGPSGCGKTTLLRILIGLVQPSSGEIYLDSKNITDLPSGERQMGIVFQNYALFENMTVLENIVYAAYIKAKKQNTDKSLSKKQIKATITDAAKKMLDKLGILELAEKHPAQLSGGQQQRVAIARTLIHNPAVMLFDEPMSALDVATRLQLRDLIKQIQADFGTTMIYITHDQEEAFSMSDRIIVMDNATISQIDTPENIIKAPANEYVKEFVVENLRKKTSSLTKYISLEQEG